MRASFLALLACVACHSGGGGTSADGGTSDGGHAVPGPGLSAAWQVESAGDLVAGPSTGGRVGDWEIANSRVRFIIEDARPSDGYDPYGCNLAAADRQRAAGEAGQSRWGEVWLGFNFRAPGCDTIEVVNDGSDGEPAVIRATGHDEESPFMASLFGASAPPALNAVIYREYTLAPDTDALTLKLTVANAGDSALTIKEPYIGMAMNRGLQHWINGNGFDFAPFGYGSLNTQAEFYAAVGQQISYSILNLGAPFSPIVNFAHVLIGQYPQMQIPAGQAQSMSFAIGVGTGDTGTLEVAHAEVRGASSETFPFSGTVVDPDNQPVAHARVHVTNTGGDQAVVFARTDENGRWTAPVRVGSYGVRAAADDRTGTSLQTVQITPAGKTDLVLQLSHPASIAARATDAQGNPMPAKIVFEPDPANPRPNLPAALGEPWDREPIIAFTPDGNASASVFPGKWHITYSRGFEYDRPTADVVAPDSGSVSDAQSLHRVIDTTGWISGDFHVHAQFSPDADDLLSQKVLAFAAEGVETPVSTEHEFIGDFSPAVQALGLQAFMHTMSGSELTTTSTGHFNLFPLLPQPSALNNGAFDWYQKTIPQVMAEVRARLTPDGSAPIVQMNHPRSPGMAYLDAVHFDPNQFAPSVDAPDWMTGWDAMEVWDGEPIKVFEGCPLATPGNGCIAPAHPQAFDWFAFLDRGYRVTGMGNSDSHNASLNETGYPRTYLQVGSDDPAALSDAQVTAAIRAMKATISGGPFVTLNIGTAGIGGLGTPDATDPDNVVVHLAVHIQAPSWMGPLARLDLWQGSTATQGATLVHREDLSALVPGPQILEYQQTFDLTVTQDTWFVAVVAGPADQFGRSSALWPVVQAGDPPYAITNPIFVDFDGNGKFDPIR